MSTPERLAVGVIVEKRDTGNQWQTFTWKPVGVVAHARPVPSAGWQEVATGPGWWHYHAATLVLELFLKETEGYCSNLSQDPPSVYVVLREDEDAGPQELEVFHATVCPYEAMGYAESGDEIVEGVPMPSEIYDWVRAFVARHHVQEPFKKRRNKAHRDRRGGSRPRGRFDPVDR